ncbi:MAG: helix-turn-helix transcriptional regulator [Cellvibrio sp.]
MNIGEKIKQLRTDKNLTQPQLAEAIGIEQSYLSKLENDKSIPSADIFQSILKALAVNVAHFLEGIDQKIIHRDLRQIPEVANYLNAEVAQKIHNIKKWLYCSAAACVIGLTLIFAGYKSLIFSNVKYEYESNLVLLSGETEESVFRFDRYEPQIGCNSADLTPCIERDAERGRKRKAAEARIKTDTLLLDNYQGKNIYRDVVGGARTYQYKSPTFADTRPNSYLMLIGSLLTFAGIFGFFVEYRLRKI